MRQATAGETHLAAPKRVAGEERSRILNAAAALSFTAALIHVSVAPAHFAEYWGFGAFFVISAAGQLVWAGLAWSGTEDRRILALGALGNLAIAVFWLASRTVGLPVGPESGQAEGLGLHDALATVDEIAVGVLVGLLLLAGSGKPPARPWLIGTAWALAGISFIGAFLGDHGAD